MALTNDEYDNCDALGLAALVRKGQVTPQELLEVAIERVESRDGMINAVVTKMYEQAKAAIAEGLPDGPFRGVPFMLKDFVVFYAGVPTTFASRLFADFVPTHDRSSATRPPDW